MCQGRKWTLGWGLDVGKENPSMDGSNQWVQNMKHPTQFKLGDIIIYFYCFFITTVLYIYIYTEIDIDLDTNVDSDIDIEMDIDMDIDMT